MYNFKLLATNIDINNGLIIGNNCYGEEKLKRLNEIGVNKCNEFYSDSLSDTPCSMLANKAYIVKKNVIIPWNDYKISKKGKIIKEFLNRDFITFVFIGTINVFNGIWIAYIYSLFITNAVTAYIAGFCTSLVIAYILNSLFNFKSNISLSKFVMFVINNIPNFIIQVSCVIILLNKLNLSKLLSYGISAIIAVPVTFLLIKLNVFRK